MIFENSELVFRVIDVLRIDQRNVKKYNENRHFCALSFREQSDACITCGGKALFLREGAVTFFPADVDYEREATVDRMTAIHFELFNYTAKEIESFVTARPQEMGQLFAAAYAEWMKNRADRQYRATALLNGIFAELTGEYLKRDGGHSPLVRRAVKYIELHFTDPGLTIPQIALHLNICEVYLRRLFRQELSMTPKQYVAGLRMQYAASLVTSGYYTVAEVAKKAGFLDEKYFSSAFKKAMGCPPSRYLYAFEE